LESRLLLLEVLEILQQLALYATIDRQKTSKRIKINKIEQQTVDYE
jgi:hypothetical protein